jgi:hypothetical protein
MATTKGLEIHIAANTINMIGAEKADPEQEMMSIAVIDAITILNTNPVVPVLNSILIEMIIILAKDLEMITGLEKDHDHVMKAHHDKGDNI